MITIKNKILVTLKKVHIFFAGKRRYRIVSYAEKETQWRWNTKKAKATNRRNPRKWKEGLQKISSDCLFTFELVSNFITYDEYNFN